MKHAEIILAIIEKLAGVGIYLNEKRRLEMLERTRQKLRNENELGELQTKLELERINDIMKKSDVPDVLRDTLITSIGRGFHEFINQYNNILLALEEVNNLENFLEIDDDWLSFYLNSIKIVESELMKTVWSKVLAASIDEGRTYPKSLLNALTLISDKEFECFCSIGYYTFDDIEDDNKYKISNYPVILFKKYGRRYNDLITRQRLIQLHNYGLIEVNFDTGFVFNKDPITLRYHKYLVTFKNQDDRKSIPSGNVVFTSNGHTLYKLMDKFGFRNRARLDVLRETYKELGIDSVVTSIWYTMI